MTVEPRSTPSVTGDSLSSRTERQDDLRGSLIAAPEVFVRRCRICGKEILTPWGPEVHYESQYALNRHIDTHSDAQLIGYARREALRV